MLPGGALNLRELEELARERLTPLAYDYYASGAHDEATLRDNVAAWARVPLNYRVLVDVSSRDTATTVLGTRVAMPVLVAPTAFHRLACAEGELATARAAGRAGTVMILSLALEHAVSRTCARRRRAPSGSSSTSTATAAPPRRSSRAPRRPGLARSCSPSTRRSSAGASATSATASTCPPGSVSRT